MRVVRFACVACIVCVCVCVCLGCVRARARIRDMLTVFSETLANRPDLRPFVDA